MIVRPAGAAEGGNLRILEREFADAIEEFKVFGIGGIRPPALDVLNTEFVEALRDHQLVIQRKCDAFGLCAVPQGGIVYLYKV